MSATPPAHVADPAPPAEDVLDSSAAGGMAVRGGIARAIAFSLALVLSLVSVPLVVRHLGVVQYGYYVTVSAIIFIIGGFSEAGLTYLGVRQYSVLDDGARDRYLRDLAGLRFTLTAAGVALATLFTWVAGYPWIVVQGTAIAGVGMLLALTQQTYAIPLLAELRLGWVSALDLLKVALLTACFLVLVAVDAGLLAFFVASVVSGVGVLAATVALVGRGTALRPSVDIAAWRGVIREVLPYAVATAAALIYFRLAVVLMSLVASDVEAGIYSTAFRIVEVASALPWMVVSTAFPILARAARDDAQRLRYATGLLFQASVLLGAGIALAIALAAPFAIDVVAGPGFEAAVPVLRLQGIALLTGFVVATWSFALLSLQRYRDLVVGALLAAATVGIATLALEPILDARGAAIATVLGEAVLAVFYLAAAARIDSGLLPDLRVVLKVLVAIGVGLLAVLIPAHPVVQTLAGVLAYGVVVLALRAVPEELFNALLRRT